MGFVQKPRSLVTDCATNCGQTAGAGWNRWSKTAGSDWLYQLIEPTLIFLVKKLTVKFNILI